MTKYSGQVLFPADATPFPGKFSSKAVFNVKVKLDDETALMTKDGVINLYRDEDDPLVPYMQGLSKGESVVLVLVDKGKGRFAYEFENESQIRSQYRGVSPAPRNQPSTPAAARQAPTPYTPPQTRFWSPVTAGEWEAFNQILDFNIEGIFQAYGRMDSDERSKIMGMEQETLRSLASTAFIQTMRTFQRGIEPAPAPPAAPDPDAWAKAVAAIGPETPGLVGVVIEKIASFVGQDKATAIADLRALGLSGNDIRKDDVNSWIRVANIYWRLYELIGNGMTKDAASEKVISEFELPTF